jgi:hypothetical protein
MAQARIERVMFSIHLKFSREVNFRRRGTTSLLNLISIPSNLNTFDSFMHIAKNKKATVRVISPCISMSLQIWETQDRPATELHSYSFQLEYIRIFPSHHREKNCLHYGSDPNRTGDFLSAMPPNSNLRILGRHGTTPPLEIRASFVKASG